MTTDAYRRWVAAGRRWSPATPISQIQGWARVNNVRVLGTIGNEDHLKADRPQDHTPFSFTAWPVALPGYVVCAIDLANVSRNGVTLGEAIERKARAGHYPWLKYMNHSGRHLDSRDLDGDGKRWEVYSSSDQHVHLSIRTDYISRNIDFDPWGDDDVSADEVWNQKYDTSSIRARFEKPQSMKALVALGAIHAFDAKAHIVALTKVIESLSETIRQGGGDVDTAAILSGVDERLKRLPQEIIDEIAS